MNHVVVAGGGLAGLSTALQLADSGCRVTLVEARHNFGGRTMSFADSTAGDVIDNGQHALMGCYHATLRYIDRIGSGGRMQRSRGLALEFRHADGRSATLQAGSLPQPFGLAQAFLGYRMLSWKSRISILRVAAALYRLPAQTLQALDAVTAADWLVSLGQDSDAMEYFWTPVILATLNALPGQASASILATVLRAMFLSDATASDMLLPDGGLSDVLIDPAIVSLRDKGVAVLERRTLTSIRTAEGKVVGVMFADGSELVCDALVLALPPWSLNAVLERAELCEDLRRVLPRFKPSSIISAHVWLARDPLLAPMTGTLGTTVQWLFNKGRSRDASWRISCTISAAAALDGASPDELRELVTKDLLPLLSLKPTDILRIVPIRERRATFLPEPGLDSVRPGAATSVDGLFLAGDWTATSLPATIESAVLSGELAAAAVRSRLKSGA